MLVNRQPNASWRRGVSNMVHAQGVHVALVPPWTRRRLMWAPRRLPRTRVRLRRSPVVGGSVLKVVRRASPCGRRLRRGEGRNHRTAISREHFVCTRVLLDIKSGVDRDKFLLVTVGNGIHQLTPSQEHGPPAQEKEEPNPVQLVNTVSFLTSSDLGTGKGGLPRAVTRRRKQSPR